jgi:hypothetical protein
MLVGQIVKVVLEARSQINRGALNNSAKTGSIGLEQESLKICILRSCVNHIE